MKAVAMLPVSVRLARTLPMTRSLDPVSPIES
jgi:hypothetical protein